MYVVPKGVCYLLGSFDFGFHSGPRWPLEHLVSKNIRAHGDGGAGQFVGYPTSGSRGLSGQRVVANDPLGDILGWLRLPCLMLQADPALDPSAMEGSLASQDLNLCLVAAARSPAIWDGGDQAAWPWGWSVPLSGIPETGTHIFFSCITAIFLWGFVCEALEPAWEALDLARFLQTRGNQTGSRRRDFWLVFTALAWTCGRRVTRWLLSEFFLGGPLTLLSNSLLSCSTGTRSLGNGIVTGLY